MNKKLEEKGSQNQTKMESEGCPSDRFNTQEATQAALDAP